MRQPGQLAIGDLLGVTAIIAIWYAGFVVSPASGWLFLGVAVIFCAASILRKPILLFFLPLVFSANLLLLMILQIAKDAPPNAISIGLMVVFIVAVSEFTIRRTCINFRASTIRKGVVFIAIRNGALSGIFVAFQFGLPCFIMGLATWFTAFPVPIGTLAFMTVFYPLLACTILGVALGGVLGFVGNWLIALNFKNRQTAVRTLEQETSG